MGFCHWPDNGLLVFLAACKCPKTFRSKDHHRRRHGGNEYRLGAIDRLSGMPIPRIACRRIGLVLSPFPTRENILSKTWRHMFGYFNRTNRKIAGETGNTLNFHPAGDVQASVHADGVVLMHAGKGIVFSSNRVGAMIWKGAAQHWSVDRLI